MDTYAAAGPWISWSSEPAWFESPLLDTPTRGRVFPSLARAC